MTPEQATAHVVPFGPYAGHTVDQVATSAAGVVWLNRIRQLISTENRGPYGQLREACNVYFSVPINSEILKANQS